mmetsp:Transcript_13554/g.50743  ORF Transcript_13554/g.50743 Transcript_13554/m.50743 type:complete len:205 (-) Transcript_13554:6502-7116(-)
MNQVSKPPPPRYTRVSSFLRLAIFATSAIVAAISGTFSGTTASSSSFPICSSRGVSCAIALAISSGNTFHGAAARRIKLFTLSSATRKRKRPAKNSRDESQGTISRIARLCNITPGVSCSAAKCVASCLNVGISSFSSFFSAAAAERAPALSLPGVVLDASPTLVEFCIAGIVRFITFTRSAFLNLMSTTPSGSSTPPFAVSLA